ncbi:hypothetical protein [Oligoflexus tunisiensis]|uniref:hypothetical protein n=1 Tax=Oligoflexus tunisiensis TaxID=708132 RepID=UPI001C402A46|nr:hypothetical protein [Oligoflexus tunisiensis]
MNRLKITLTKLLAPHQMMAMLVVVLKCQMAALGLVSRPSPAMEACGQTMARTNWAVTPWPNVFSMLIKKKPMKAAIRLTIPLDQRSAMLRLCLRKVIVTSRTMDGNTALTGKRRFSF